MNTKPKLSSNDIARLAGVSQATVSRVLSGASNVRPETRDKVMRVIEDSGYRPNAFAQAMRTNQSGTVGVAVSRITNPIVPEILEALAAQLTRQGRRMVVWNTDTEGEDGVVSAMETRMVDGVIFTAASHQITAVEAAVRLETPVVSINRPVKGAHFEQIVSTNHEGAAEMARYLHQCGRSRIAYVTGPEDRTTLADRERGFREALRGEGAELDPDLCFRRDFGASAFRQIGMDLAARAMPPDTIACGNDLIAIQILNGLRASGLRVPEDIWVTGFDGIAMSGWDIVDLTTMRQPLELMATDAAQAIVALIDNKTAQPRIVEYRTELCIRGSTANMRPPRQG